VWTRAPVPGKPARTALPQVLSQLDTPELTSARGPGVGSLHELAHRQAARGGIEAQSEEGAWAEFACPAAAAPPAPPSHDRCLNRELRAPARIAGGIMQSGHSPERTDHSQEKETVPIDEVAIEATLAATATPMPCESARCWPRHAR